MSFKSRAERDWIPAYNRRNDDQRRFFNRNFLF